MYTDDHPDPESKRADVREMVLSLIGQLRVALERLGPSRESSIARTKLDECEMWADRATPMARREPRNS